MTQDSLNFDGEPVQQNPKPNVDKMKQCDADTRKALKQVEKNGNKAWMRRCEVLILDEFVSRNQFMAWHVTDRMAEIVAGSPSISTPTDKLVGPVLNNLARAGRIHQVGIDRNPKSHGRKYPVWSGIVPRVTDVRRGTNLNDAKR